jgi:hypothetical protein
MLLYKFSFDGSLFFKFYFKIDVTYFFEFTFNVNISKVHYEPF